MCFPCLHSTLNTPCGDMACKCECNKAPILHIPEPDPATEPFRFDQQIVVGDPPPITTPPTYTTTTANDLIQRTEPDPPDDMTDTTAFWLGIVMGLPMGIVGMADSLNPWVRGILIGLSVLTALVVAGRMAREDT
jgi:hypothetical protein